MRRRIRLGGLMLLIAFIGLGLGIYRRLVIGESVVYVQGDVKLPGKLPIDFGMTVSDALKAAGDVTSPGESSIRLIRPSPPGVIKQQVLESVP